MIESKISFGAFEAKTHFSALLDRVEEHGERITITRHGREVAVLAPFQQTPSKDRMALIKRSLALSKGTRLPNGKTIKDLINEGRKR
jgi:prevent-host-death family protein